MTDKNADLLRAQVIEECANTCKKLAEMFKAAHPWEGNKPYAAECCESAIRALATAPQDATSNAEGRHPDDVAVDRFAAAMKEKLAVKRAQGRGGWDDPEQCSLDYLVRLFHDHVSKGDPIDIGNFAMMLWNRMAAANLPIKYKHIPSAPTPQQQDDCVRVPIKVLWNAVAALERSEHHVTFAQKNAAAEALRLAAAKEPKK